MRVSERQAQIEQLWTSTIRQTRRAVQAAEKQSQEREQQLLSELEKARDADCPSAILNQVERALDETDSIFQSELRGTTVQQREKNINLKLRGLDALLTQNNKQWQDTAIFLQNLADYLEKAGEQRKDRLTRKVDEPQRVPPTAPKIDDSSMDAIQRVAGRNTDIDLMLRELDTVLDSYQRRKRFYRIALQVTRILLFLVLFGLIVDWLLSLIQSLGVYLLAAVALWLLDDYLIRPTIERALEQWNVRALKQTITEFFRAQRRALYLSVVVTNEIRAADIEMQRRIFDAALSSQITEEKK